MLRIENKYNITRDKKVNFFKWLSENNIKTLFPSRNIYSIYFDNSNYDIYTNSIEGCVPRKKIRLRTYKKYNNQIKNYTLEIKETNFTFRSKKTFKNFSSNILSNGYFDNIYGICYPKIVVSYERSYFLYKSHRITFDENIKYSEYNFFSKNLIFLRTNEVIFEVKNNNIHKNNEIEKLFPFAKTRFSKYTNGIENLNLF